LICQAGHRFPLELNRWLNPSPRKRLGFTPQDD
jgi:hypothetical protein